MKKNMKTHELRSIKIFTVMGEFRKDLKEMEKILRTDDMIYKIFYIDYFFLKQKVRRKFKMIIPELQQLQEKLAVVSSDLSDDPLSSTIYFYCIVSMWDDQEIYDFVEKIKKINVNGRYNKAINDFMNLEGHFIGALFDCLVIIGSKKTIEGFLNTKTFDTKYIYQLALKFLKMHVDEMIEIIDNLKYIRI